MRTIKFRGKRLDSKEWVTGCYTCGTIGGRVTYVDDCHVWSETIGEYLGRKDNHNNEIYEGDYVKDQNGSIWEVKFNEEHPYWIPFVFPCNDAPENFEVIGNKWDNPELAKEV